MPLQDGVHMRFEVTPRMAKAVQRAAQNEDRTVSALIRRAIEMYLVNWHGWDASQEKRIRGANYIAPKKNRKR